MRNVRIGIENIASYWDVLLNIKNKFMILLTRINYQLNFIIKYQSMSIMFRALKKADLNQAVI